MKTWKHFAVVGFLAIIALAFTACPPEPKPTHTHDSGEWITTLEPTCTEAGSKELRCTVDGVVLNTTTIVALGHDWIDNWQTTAPTCTETGGDKRICNRANCTETQSQNETTALGHDYQNYTQTTAPTCTTEGVSTGTCSHDSTHKDTRTIDALGHTPNTETGICTICNALTYNLGDTGPGGGKIFYRSENGFTMTDDNSTAHYLEAAPADMGTPLRWASVSFIPPSFGGTGGTGDWVDISGTATDIGTGRKNTALILAIDAEAPAAKACDDYNNNSRDDWFLPSRNELWELLENMDSVGNLVANQSYWSSWQYSESHGFRQYFNINSGGSYSDKQQLFLVRAIRAF